MSKPRDVLAKMYTLELLFEEDLELPRWKGNLTRGALAAMLAGFCLRGEPRCSKCELAQNCPYGYIVRTLNKGNVLGGRRASQDP
ncbi:hypothetical protein IG193_01305 [Infirmifilum lucidum]|uniref:Uncharacterized protein n=1 Tax=Infirmifilum lucidum TaxID=2776706 RepID=A0A7L9FHK0_9CREN|nr:hypothetical protein [Infirmifilum lucidum]QOJ79131.1 hypothetical protein IG193_01305 [Infirmifilum lucidum]